ncbi:MAG: hypothetical protein OHK0023_00690 [Anaerolineae bacterium]
MTAMLDHEHLTDFTPRLDARARAEFLAITAQIINVPHELAEAALNGAALRLRHLEPPRDADIPTLPPKVYPRPTQGLIEVARAELTPPPPPKHPIGEYEPQLNRAIELLLADQNVMVVGSQDAGIRDFLRHVVADTRLGEKFSHFCWADEAFTPDQLATLIGIAYDAPYILIAPPEARLAIAVDLLNEARTLLIFGQEAFASVHQSLPPNAKFIAAVDQPVEAVAQITLSGTPDLALLKQALQEQDGYIPELDPALSPLEQLAALYQQSFAALPSQYAGLLRAFAALPRRAVPFERVVPYFGNPLAARRALNMLSARRFLDHYPTPQGDQYRIIGPWADALELTEADAAMTPAFRALDLYAADQAKDERAERADLLHKQGADWFEEARFEEAEAALREALGIRESLNLRYAAAQTLSVLARLAYLRGDEAIAVLRLERAAEILHKLRDAEGIEVVRLALCRAYRRAGRYDAALSIVDDTAPPEDLAVLYRMQGEWDKSLHFYEKWAEIDEDSVLSARMGYAETLILADRKDEAREFAERRGGFLGAWIKILLKLLEDDMQGALADYAQLETLTPSRWRSVVARAISRAMAAQGMVREAKMLVGAEGVWYEARQPYPAFARMRLSQALYAHFALMLGETAEAEQAAEAALAPSAERFDLEAAALAARVLARIAKARDDLAQAVQHTTNELAAWEKLADRAEMAMSAHHLGDLQMAQGELASAVSSYRRADALLPLMKTLIALRRDSEVTEVAAQLMTRLSADDSLPLIGYVSAQWAIRERDAVQRERVLEVWVAVLASRLAEALQHPDAAVRVSASALIIRSQPALDDSVRLIDLAENALMLAEQIAPQSLASYAARRDLGQLYVRLQRPQEALEAYTPLLPALPRLNQTFVALDVHWGMAHAYLQLGDMAQAASHFASAVQHEPDETKRGELLVSAANALRDTGDDHRAVDFYANAAEILRRERDLKPYVEVLIQLAYARYRLRRFSEALETFSEALRIVERATPPDPTLMAQVLADMGAAHFALGQYRNASSALRQSLALQDQYHAPEVYARTLLALARSERAFEAYQSAANAYHEALPFTIFSREERTALLSEYAAVLARLGQGRAAIDAYEDALQQESGTVTERAALHQALGGIYAELGDHDAAKEHYEAALALLRDAGETPSGTAYRALADTYRALGEIDAAIATYRQALTLLTDSKHKGGVERALGEVYLQTGDLAAALLHLERALELERGQQLQEGGVILSILSSLVSLHEARGEFERAAARCHEMLVYQDLRHAAEAHLTTLNRLGRLYTEMKRYGEAARAYEESLKLEEKLPQKNAARIEGTTYAFAKVRQAQGLIEAAADLYQQVTNSPRQTPAQEQARLALNSLRAEIGRHMAALQAAEQSRTLLTRSGADLKSLAFILALEAQTYAALGRRAACEGKLAELYELLAARRAELDQDDAALVALGLLLRGVEADRKGEASAAEAAFQEALNAAQSDERANSALLWTLRYHVS